VHVSHQNAMEGPRSTPLASQFGRGLMFEQGSTSVLKKKKKKKKEGEGYEIEEMAFKALHFLSTKELGRFNVQCKTSLSCRFTNISFT
jgi:hypothetical protein